MLKQNQFIIIQTWTFYFLGNSFPGLTHVFLQIIDFFHGRLENNSKWPLSHSGSFTTMLSFSDFFVIYSITGLIKDKNW